MSFNWTDTVPNICSVSRLIRMTADLHTLKVKKEQDLCLSPPSRRQRPSASVNSVARSSGFYPQLLIFSSINQNGNQAETLALQFSRRDTTRTARSPFVPSRLTAPRKSDGDTFRLHATAARPPTSPQVKCIADASHVGRSAGRPSARRRTFGTSGLHKVETDERRNVNGCSD